MGPVLSHLRLSKDKGAPPKGKNLITDEIVEIWESDDNEVPMLNRSLSAFPCGKNPGHHGFHSIESVELTTLPQDIRYNEVLGFIIAHAKLVVKIRVNKEKSFSTGTGYAWLTGEAKEWTCTFGDCEISPNPHKVKGGIVIYTNHHVVSNDTEALNAHVDFFFDSSEQTKMVKARGYRLRETVENKDLVGLKVIQHDPTLVDYVKKYSEAVTEAWSRIPKDVREKLKKHAIVISHPHGFSKQISFGNLLGLEEDEENDGDDDDLTASATQYRNSRVGHGSHKRVVTTYDTPTCQGSSGAPVISGHYAYRPFTHCSYLPSKDAGASFFY